MNELSILCLTSLFADKYVERLKDEAELVAVCTCKTGGCGESCLNRYAYRTRVAHRADTFPKV